VFKKGKENFPLDQRMVPMKAIIHTHKNLMTNFRLNEPNDYKIFCGWLVHHWMSYSRLLPLQLPKDIYARSSHTQAVLSIMLGYLASGDTLET